MLNITDNTIKNRIDITQYSALQKTEEKRSGKIIRRLLLTALGIVIVICMLPWTQNIQSSGFVTALKPEQRPQTIHSVIAGRIESWHVQEGQYVEKGDTILRLSEVKESYFDPALIERSQEQLSFKESGILSYEEKIQALENQISALQKTRDLKLEQAALKLQQARYKVNTDSMELVVAATNQQIAREQYERMKQLHADGLKSLVDLENRQTAWQKANSQLIAAENKLLASQSEWLNAQVELVTISANYQYEIAKAESEKNSAIGNKLDAQGERTKLANQVSNLEIRNDLYFITAPQDGYITKALKSGVGELIKEGEPLVSIMPADYDLAVEMYIHPIDLPLIKKGQRVRIRFDGWPAIVFSGWPNSSYGTYGGEVYAIDNFISENGKYRVLVVPDKNDEPWPQALRVGSGTNNMLMLNDVPVWYELWRQINGFPPDFYQQESKQADRKNK